MATKTFRVFVSSTFADFKAERDALQEKVFPRLRDLCEERGARFQAIDLRWGVSDEAALDQQTMNICLEELQRCRNVTPRPNFLVLLGQRYGWRPLPPQIESTEFMAILERVPAGSRDLLGRWYCPDYNAVPAEHYLLPRTGEMEGHERWEPVERDLHESLLAGARQLGLTPDRLALYERSATEQEIMRGALVAEPDGAFCYLRTIDGLPEDEAAGEFLDFGPDKIRDGEAAGFLDDLIRRLEEHLPESALHRYRATWSPAHQRPTTVHVQSLCDRIEADLTAAIHRELPETDDEDDLEGEINAHAAFAASRTADFIGRNEPLERIANYVRSQSDAPLLVVGLPGSGKSTLMARAAAESAAEDQKRIVVSRFIGATPLSSNILSLLTNVCRQVGREYDAATAGHDTVRDAAAEFARLLAFATPERPLVLFLDALDQLSEDDVRNVGWLPRLLPPDAKLVLSVLVDDVRMDAAKNLLDVVPVENRSVLGPLAHDEGEELLRSWLGRVRRTIRPDQTQEVLEKFDLEGLPLYLKLAFDQARRWRSGDPSPSLAAGTRGIVSATLAGIEEEGRHGFRIASRALGYLCASRDGLTEDELLSVLSSDAEVLADFRRRSPRSPFVASLPVAVWARLLSDIDPYLSVRAADGTRVLSFFHRIVREVTTERYLGGQPGKLRHRRLASYFAGSPTWSDPTTLRPNLRKTTELPYQQAAGRMRRQAEETLCDCGFIEAKVRAERLFDLLHDYGRLLEMGTSPVLESVLSALSQGVPPLVARPELALQTLFNRLQWATKPDAAIVRLMDDVHHELDQRGPWLRVRARPQGAGGASFDFSGSVSSVQSVSPNRRLLALHYERTVEIRSLPDGSLLEGRPSPPDLAALTVDENARVTWLRSDGTLEPVWLRRSLPGRPGDRRIAFHPDVGLAWATSDNELHLLEAATGDEVVLSAGLPAPLSVLQIVATSPSILYLAGDRDQALGVIDASEGEWRASFVAPSMPRMLHAALDDSGRSLVVACLDRRLRAASLNDVVSWNEIAYESQPDVQVRGAVELCAWGVDAYEGWVLFATNQGHLAAWHPEGGELVRLEDWQGLRERNRLVQLLPLEGDGGVLVATDVGVKARRVAGEQQAARHSGEVTACLTTGLGTVVTASSVDSSLRWFHADGLSPVGDMQRVNITALGKWDDSDACLVGSSEGLVWLQPPGAHVPAEQKLHLSSQPIVSVLRSGEGRVVAADRTGWIRSCTLEGELREVIATGDSRIVQHRIMRGPGRAVLTARTEFGPLRRVVSAVLPDEERIVRELVPSDMMWDVDASPDASLLLICGDAVTVERTDDATDRSTLTRDRPASRGAFLAEGTLLAVALADEEWLEVWRVESGLPQLAAIELPASATSLSAAGERIVVGLRSGDVLSLTLEARTEAAAPIGGQLT